MGTHTGSVLTLANSIIGVSVLAMPFCFKQCGIVLSIVMLILSNVVTRLACYYLLKSAIMEKRKNFEMLAFRVLGRSGKLIVELCIIGFMLGTCVAFFVVVGDLGPTILAEIIGVEHPSALRPSVLIGLGVFVVLPLGLLRNVESLSTLCAASIAFYVCLVLKVMGEATSHLLAWDWMDKVSFWRPAGILQCMPIFSMALSCQTQLFEVFDSLPSTPMERMNSIIRSAINMTTTFYIAVGFFGYVAFCNQPFTGNLLINLSPSVVSYVIKLGFVLSVAVSFPLVIFPCRASIYSLIFTTGSLTGGVEGSSHIPETKFQCITLVIVTLSLVTGLLVPSIEAVLGFVGSTIGLFVSIILPSIFFICLSKKNTSERLLAKVLACMGLLTMVLSTYANLTAVENTPVNLQPPDIPLIVPVIQNKLDLPRPPQVPDKVVQQDPPKKLEVREEDMKKLKDVDELKKLVLPKLQEAKSEDKAEEIVVEKDEAKSRKEPPIPEVKSRQEPPNPVPEEPKVPPKKKKTVLVPPLLKDEVKIKNKIDIEEIKKSIEKLELPKSVEVEKVDEVAVENSIKDVDKTLKLSKIDYENKTEISKDQKGDSKIDNDVIKIINPSKSSLAESIANGVPLPLAVKGKLSSNKEAKAIIKEREKRDTAFEEQEPVDHKIENDNMNGSKAAELLNIQNVEVNKGDSFVKVISKEAKDLPDEEQCLKNNTDESHKNMKNDTGAAVETIDPVKYDSIVQSDRHNDSASVHQGDKVVEESLITQSSVMKDLIKTPAYLSDPKIVLDSKAILHGPEPKFNVESAPLKRDLKSVQENNIDGTKTEHR